MSSPGLCPPVNQQKTKKRGGSKPALAQTVAKENAGPMRISFPENRFLALLSNCTRTLPDDVLSDLRKECPQDLAVNGTRQASAPACTCKLLRGAAPRNSTACVEMLSSCGDSSVAISVGVSLLFLLLICGIGCVWCWKRPDLTQCAFPRFLRRRHSRRCDYVKTLSANPRPASSRYKAPVQAREAGPAAGEASPCDNYENLEAAPPAAEEADQGLYENTQPRGAPEHVYGNQEPSVYYDFQKAASPQDAQDEDIYIIPD